MRRSVLICAIALLMILSALVPVAQRVHAETGIEVGNYWEYEFSGDMEGFSATGTLRMKVIGTSGSGSNEAFLVENRGSGVFSGSLEGFDVSGALDISGETRRLVSNFSMISTMMDIDMEMNMMGTSISGTMFMNQSATPPLDDYIGDSNPGHGGQVTSSTSMWVSSSMNIMGFSSDEEDTYNSTATMAVGAVNQTVTVPAGTFDCYVITYSVLANGTEEISTFYYSDKVGNYVKMSSPGGGSLGILGDAELKSYSYGSESWISSLFSGTNLIILIVVIIAVVVILSLVLVFRKRGKGAAPASQESPFQTGPQPPLG